MNSEYIGKGLITTITHRTEGKRENIFGEVLICFVTYIYNDENNDIQKQNWRYKTFY